MPFKRVFERKVNENMQEDKAGPSFSKDSSYAEEDVIKYDDSKQEPHDEEEEEDIEMFEKKDRPPRFSTLFGTTPPPRAVYDQPPPRRKSGIMIPTPLFIVLAITLFFESTLLFAYTVIGFYSNLPFRLSSSGGIPTAASVASACVCDKQPSINVSPNFYLPQGQNQGSSITTITISDTSSTTSTTHSITSSTSKSSSTTSSTSSTNNAIVVSNIVSLLEQAATRAQTTGAGVTTVKSVVTPTVTSVDLVTSIAAPDTTATSVTHITGSDGTTTKTTNGGQSSTTTASSQTKSTTTPSPPPTSTTLKTTTSPTSTTTSSPSASASRQACFGGSGGVELDCTF